MIINKKNIWIIISLAAVILFFSFLLIKKGVPLPADALVGMYHPWRDLYKKEFPVGYPYKNFLITDPVRQQYPWKTAVINQFKQKQLPLWNPYSFSGYPLLANFQSGAFYFINILFLTFNFNLGWSLYIILQPVLALLFMYLFLKDKVDRFSALIGSIAFSFSGFIVAWFEWGNVGHTFIWLPLIFYTLEKIIRKKSWKYALLFIFALSSSFFAGHLQTAFYVILVSVLYSLSMIFKLKKTSKILAIKRISIAFLFFTILTSIQWLPTLNLIQKSTRGLNVPKLLFLPFKHLIQMFFPDFFGNPATLNYWGEWNYLEYISYIGIIPIFFALYYIFSSSFSKNRFFKITLIISILFATNNPIAKLPFALNIPFISTSSPARLVSLICFSSAVLSAYGAKKFLKQKKIKALLIFTLFIFISWVVVYFLDARPHSKYLRYNVTKRNLILPTAIFLTFACGFFIKNILKKFLNKKIAKYLEYLFLLGILIIVLFDGFRFLSKFNPFIKKDLIYPDTKILSYLQEDKEKFRVIAPDERILIPNSAIPYKIETVQGYDPLMLKNYVSLVQYSETGEFNKKYPRSRIVQPQNIETGLIDILNVKYLLTFDEFGEEFEKIMEEGETKLYKNPNYLPRIYFANELQFLENKEEIYKKIINEQKTTTDRIVYKIGQQENKVCDQAEILESNIKANQITVKTNNSNDCYLVVSQVYYPTWSVIVDNKKKKIEQVNSIFPAVKLNKGEHEVTFKNNLL